MFTPTITYRDAIVDYARSRLGCRDAKIYWASVVPGAPERDYPRSWCGAFCMAAINAACGTSHVWGAKGTGFRFTPRDIVREPEPGDVVYIHHPYQHHALFVRAEGDTIYTIDGNVRGTKDEPFPGVPAVRERVYKRRDVTNVYSIERFLPT